MESHSVSMQLSHYCYHPKVLTYRQWITVMARGGALASPPEPPSRCPSPSAPANPTPVEVSPFPNSYMLPKGSCRVLRSLEGTPTSRNLIVPKESLNGI